MRNSWTISLLLVLIALTASCSDETATQEAIENSPYLVHLEGDAAHENLGFFFVNRTSDTVYVKFSEPFLLPPDVELPNKDLDYTYGNLSEWGFTLRLLGIGFWKDASFKVSGNRAGTTRFCRETDTKNDTFYGGTVYSASGTFVDICQGEEMKVLKEYYCDGSTLRSEQVECEYNCYDERGPAFCVNDYNVREPCDDQFPDVDFFTKNFVSYNGRRYYDVCIGQIHGTRKELTENTCDGVTLKEVNHFCEYGCFEGRCLHAEEAFDPEDLTVTFFVYANSTNIDDWVRFGVRATDIYGIQSLHFFEYNSTQMTELTWANCDGTIECEAQWKIARYDAGIRSFSVQVLNIRNNTADKNITLNFSGDIYAPSIEFNVSPYFNEMGNFTYINASASDTKGVQYLAVYQQTSETQWELLDLTECKELGNCTLAFRTNSTSDGLVRFIAKSLDVNRNAGFQFASAYYASQNKSIDRTPPNVTFEANLNSTTVTTPVIFSFVVKDEVISSLRLYKQEPESPWYFISSFDCGNDLTLCEGEFAYTNTMPGDVRYLLNATDHLNNYNESVLTLHYEPLNESGKTDSSGPNVTMYLITVDDGVTNKTSIEYRAIDNNTITYMNLYEKTATGYDLLRTKFCFRQTECEATFERERIKAPTTFLVAAADVQGNRGELEQTWDP